MEEYTMQLNIGDTVFNRVPAHYYKNSIGVVKEITQTEIIIEYKLSEKTNINIRHNIFDLKYLDKIEVA
jgi:hypothetical protein